MVGRKDGPQKEAVSLSSFIYSPLKTFIRESLTLSCFFLWGNAEPWSKTPCLSAGGKVATYRRRVWGSWAPRYVAGPLLLKQVKVGHELQLGTRMGCSQQEVWTPVSPSGGSHGNATSFFWDQKPSNMGWVNCSLKTCGSSSLSCVRLERSMTVGSRAFDSVPGGFSHGNVGLAEKPRSIISNRSLPLVHGPIPREQWMWRLQWSEIFF